MKDKRRFYTCVTRTEHVNRIAKKKLHSYSAVEIFRAHMKDKRQSNAGQHMVCIYVSSEKKNAIVLFTIINEMFNLLFLALKRN